MPDNDLVLVVWLNPDRAHKPNSRLLHVLMDHKTNLPSAFSLKNLKNSPIMGEFTVANQDTLAEDLLASTPLKPVLVPIFLADMLLGWSEFTEYEAKK